MSTARFFLSCAALCGLTAVLFGAFGAHALNSSLTATMMSAYEKAVDYHAIHALAILAIGIMLNLRQDPCLVWAGNMMLAGILLFSGSLYMMAITDNRAVAWITPIGGTAFVIAWACLFKAAIRFNRITAAKNPAKE